MYELSSNGKLVGNDVPYFFAPKPWAKTFAYSSKLKNLIWNSGNFDIYHAQGIWGKVKFLKTMSNTKILIIDDFLMQELTVGDIAPLMVFNGIL